MMHLVLIVLHSFFRWIILVSMVFALYRGMKSLLTDKKFSRTEELLRKYIAMLVHIQLVLGLWLYVISPEITYFWANFNTAVHVKELRFFAMEHSVMMLIAVAIITAGSILTKKIKSDKPKIIFQLCWVFLGLASIFVTIPWPFFWFSLPRPYFRWF